MRPKVKVKVRVRVKVDNDRCCARQTQPPKLFGRARSIRYLTKF